MVRGAALALVQCSEKADGEGEEEEEGTLLRPVLQAVQACSGGEGEVSKSGMT